MHVEIFSNEHMLQIQSIPHWFMDLESLLWIILKIQLFDMSDMQYI